MSKDLLREARRLSPLPEKMVEGIMRAAEDGVLDLDYHVKFLLLLGVLKPGVGAKEVSSQRPPGKLRDEGAR